MADFDRESYFISLLKNEGITKGVGDDCCVINPISKRRHVSHIHAKNLSSLVVGMDSFCEDVHFVRNWFSPYEIAFKAFLVNYSDIVAMNATPLYATLSVALAKCWKKEEIKAFVKGIGDFCKTYKIVLIGGDTVSAKNIQIHITLFAKANKHTLYRDRISVGDILCTTKDTYPSNTITKCYKVLKMLLNQPKNQHLKPNGRFLSPRIRASFIHECAHFIKGAMDISDGILNEIRKLCAINHLSFKPCIPFFAPHSKVFLNSGEVYEMLIAVSPKDILKLKRKAMRHRIQIQMLGTFGRKKNILPLCKHWH